MGENGIAADPGTLERLRAVWGAAATALGQAPTELARLVAELPVAAGAFGGLVDGARSDFQSAWGRTFLEYEEAARLITDGVEWFVPAVRALDARLAVEAQVRGAADPVEAVPVPVPVPVPVGG